MKTMTNKIFSLVLSASMLASLLPVSALAAGFSDVPQGIYYEDPVDWAVENDITSGTSGTEFSHSQAHTLQLQTMYVISSSTLDQSVQSVACPTSSAPYQQLRLAQHHNAAAPYPSTC